MKTNVSGMTITSGIILIVVGLLGRFLTGTTSITALIPLFFGVPIAGLGWVSQTPARARIAIIIVTVMAVLGPAGSFNVMHDLFSGTVCLFLLAINVRWFMQARVKSG